VGGRFLPPPKVLVILNFELANVFFELRLSSSMVAMLRKAPGSPMLRGQGDGVNRVDEVSGALGTVERWKGAAVAGKLWCVEMAAWSLEPNGWFLRTKRICCGRFRR